MKSRVGVGLGAVAVAVAVAATWVLVRTDSSGAVEPVSGSTRRAPLAEELASVASVSSPAAADRADALPVGTADGRVAQAEPRFSGSVVGAGGEPIEGCEVSWTSLDLSSRPTVDEIAAASVRVRSSSDGRFEFRETPPRIDTRGSVVWFTDVDHLALAIALDADSRAWTKGATYALEACPRRRVLVLDEQDSAVSGAIVTQAALPGEHVLDGRDVSVAFVHEFATGVDGLADIVPIDGRQRLVARSGTGSSPPWEGTTSRAGPLVLRIASTFRIGGAITRFEGVSDATALMVFVQALDEGRRHTLASVEAALSDWGPIDVAAPERIDHLVVRLEAQGIITREQARAAPSAGESLLVDLTAEVGRYLWFYVVDASNEDVVLPDAKATVSWVVDGRMVEKTVAAREDGYIPVDGCPDGVVSPSFRCPGYEQTVTEPIVLPMPEEGAVLVALNPASRMAGKVVAGGAPVSDFELVFWPTNQPGYRGRKTFTGAEDGRFELDEVPRGTVAVVAAAPGIGQSQRIVRSVTADGVDNVLLELVTGIRGHGRVIEDATGLPVLDARIAVHVVDELIDFGPRESVAKVDARGEFVVEGLSLGQSLVVVGAPGFASEQLRPTTVQGEDVDLGTVALRRAQRLRVRILMPPGVDPRSYTLLAGAATPLPPRVLDANGAATYESASPGRHYVTAVSEEHQAVELSLPMTLGREWDFTYDVSGDEELIVEVHRGGRPVPSGTLVRLTRARDLLVLRCRTDADGRATLLGMGPRSVLVEVLDEGVQDYQTLATRRLTMADGESRTLRIDLEADGGTIRVVDAEGAPISGAAVTVIVDGEHWTRELTNEDGDVVVRGLPHRFCRLHIGHAAHGFRLGVDVELETNDLVEVTLDGRASPVLVFEHPDGPAVGVQPELTDPFVEFMIPGANTDESGHVQWRGLTAGRYLLRLDDLRYWRVAQMIDVVDGMAPQRIELLRRCSLVLDVTSGGVPVSGARVDLQWLDGDLSVRQMITDREVVTVPDGLVTSAIGKLSVAPPPEGRYRWSCRDPDRGELVEGELVLVPGATNDVRLELGG